jgi:hypothetical protein
MHRRGFNWSDCKSASADATGSASRSVEEQCFSTPASSLVSVVACLVRRSGSWEGIRYSVPHGVGRWDRMEASEAGRPCGVVCRVPPLLGVDSLSAGGRGGGFVCGPGVKRCGRRQMECMHLDGQQIGRRARRRQTPKPIHLADDAIVVETGGSLCSSFGWKAGLCTATLALKPRPSPCPSPSSFKAPDEARRSFLLPRSSCSAQCSPVLFYYRDELSWPISLAAAANPDLTVTAGLCIKRPDSARRIATTRRPRSLDRLPRSLPAYLRVYLSTCLPIPYTLIHHAHRPRPAASSGISSSHSQWHQR